jgi:polynucleotide 5'-kinase involved in rRNA processing
MTEKSINPWDGKIDIDQIASKKNVIIIGGVDTGKSSLVEYLCTKLANEIRLGLISADLGQSLFGLPTCFSYSRYKDEKVRELNPDKMIFIGSASPRGNFLKVVSAFHRLLRVANQENEVTLIDTDGLVYDSAGKEYKAVLIEMLEDGFVIVVQKEDEVKHIIEGVIEQISIPYVLIDVPQNIKEKSIKERTSYRQNKFLQYFSNKIEKSYVFDCKKMSGMVFGLGKVMDQPTLDVLTKMLGQQALYGEYGKYEFGIVTKDVVDRDDIVKTSQEINIKKLVIYPVSMFKNLLAGFNDNEGFTKVVGIIKDIEFPAFRMNVFLPWDIDINDLYCTLGKEHIILEQT